MRNGKRLPTPFSGDFSHFVGIRFFTATAGPVRGTVVVAPGLNNRPQAMDPLIRILGRAGFHSLRVSLHQVRRGDRQPADTVARQWVDDIAEAYAVARSRDAKIPVFNLSYSLGALATLRFLQRTPSARFAAMVLLAPPLSLTRGARMVRALTPFRSLGLALPSLAPVGVRARASTPLVEYAALLQLVDDVRGAGSSVNFSKTATRVLVGRDDELVSRRGVKAWVEENRLTGWNVESLDVKPTAHSSRHLMISKASVGDVAWHAITRAVIEQFTR